MDISSPVSWDGESVSKDGIGFVSGSGGVTGVMADNSSWEVMGNFRFRFFRFAIRSLTVSCYLIIYHLASWRVKISHIVS